VKRLLVALAACSAPAHPTPTCTPTDIAPSPAWYGTNRQDLQAWLDASGCRSPHFDPAHPPVALFDWDNTIGKNDFGDALTFWMIAHGKIHRPAGGDWHATSPFLTDAAATALAHACGDADPVPSAENPACADAMLDVYLTSAIGGAPAFAGADPRWMEPAFAWTAQLLAGYTHAEIRDFTNEVTRTELAAPEGTTQTVGTHAGLDAWLRVYPEQRELIRAARSRGFDVWVITASPTDAIATVAPLAGIDADHVVGIHQLVDGAGRLTARFEGCGPFPDGQTQLINHAEGKRCAANKYVFGDRSAQALEVRAPPRQVFAAGDSDSDVFMLQDATYRFALNRNKPALMCAAYGDPAAWRVNPMFIGPLPELAAGYACPSGHVGDAVHVP
jgi:phosphoserine phosphatase